MDDDLIPDVLVEPAVPRRVCTRCGCSWDADVDICPECAELTRNSECSYCAAHGFDHRVPGSKPFAVWLHSERDGDGQPTMIVVCYSAGYHVGEGEVEYVREALRQRHERVS